jgi:catalase
MFWDYLSNNPESIHQVMWLFGDRGIPDGYRKMQGYSGHTFKLVNKAGEWVYAQTHLLSQQGVEFLTQEKATELAGKAPDYATKDLFEAIDKGDFPKWKIYVQSKFMFLARRLAIMLTFPPISHDPQAG